MNYMILYRVTGNPTPHTETHQDNGMPHTRETALVRWRVLADTPFFEDVQVLETKCLARWAEIGEPTDCVTCGAVCVVPGGTKCERCQSED